MPLMGKGKARGSEELPIDAVQMILEYNPECIMEAFNDIHKTKKMLNEWRKSRTYVYSKARVVYWSAKTT